MPIRTKPNRSIDWRTGKAGDTWTDPVSVRFSPETREVIRAAARREGCTAAEWIRRACEERLARDVGTEG